MKHIYQESGANVLVEVLSDVRDDEGMRRVKMKLLDQPTGGMFFGSGPGDEVEVSAMRGYEHYIGWKLEEAHETVLELLDGGVE